MHNNQYVLPENGKIFYLLTDAEVKSFNYYKEHGSKHGLNVSLKVAMTEFGRVLVVHISKLERFLKSIVEKSERIITNRKAIQRETNTEIAKRQGIPQSIIDTYMRNSTPTLNGAFNTGMYRDLKNSNAPKIIQKEDTLDQKTMSLWSIIIAYIRRLF